MKNLLPILFFIFFTMSFNCFAQTGPGGVGTNDGSSTLDIWLRDINHFSDAGSTVSTSGSVLQQWNDASGNNNHAIQIVNNRKPQFNTNLKNSYPTLEFSGDDELRVAYNISPNVHPNITVIAVADHNTATNSPFSKLFGHDDSGYDRAIGFDTRCGATSFHYFGGGVNCFVSPSVNSDFIVNAQYTNSSFSGWFNGNLIINNAANGNGNGESFLTIGNVTDRDFGKTYNEFWNGSITEFIVFGETINTAQHIIVSNYLSAKYNVGLTNNDFYTQDNSGNGNFDHDVAGIGQASDGTNHTDSRGTGIVRISSPSTLSSGDFLFWGEETKDPTYDFTTNTTSYYEELNSKWRVSKINDLGTVTVTFDITGVDLSGKQSCQPLQLAVDNNSDFSSPTTYDATLVGNTATITGVTFTDGDYFTLRYLDQIVWDGTSFFNGSGAANAPNDTNECLKFTVKPGAISVLTFDAHVREIEVENGGTVIVSDGILLEIEDQVVVDGVIDLFGEAQLIQNHSNTTSNAGIGELRVRQQGTVNLYNYNYWSSPVNRGGNWQIGYLEEPNGVVNFTTSLDANPSTTPITLSNRWLYDFNSVSGEYSGWNFLSPTDNLSPGRGYTMKGSGIASAEQEYIFKGIPNDGNYTYTVTANNDFLVGNPYPSAIDADEFINDNLSVIDGTLYFWEHFTSNSSHNLVDYEGGYATYNLMMSLPAIADNSGLTSGNGVASKDRPTKNITIGQGFFVTIDNGGSLVFNNAQRIFSKESDSTTIFYRSNAAKNITTTETEDDRMKIWLSFKEPAEHTRIIGLGYDPNTTTAYDKGYDAKAYEDQRNELYWILNNDKLSIQALPQFDNTQELPIGVKVTDTGMYEFSIDDMENVPSDVTVYLKDIHNDTYYNLSNSEASIWLDAAVDDTRFSIVFQESGTLSVAEESLNDILLVYDDDSERILLKNIEQREIKQLSIYSIVGQQILTKNDDAISLNINISQLQQGTYILKINTDTGIKNFKFIKY